jgi:hypothetical protein
MTFTKLLNKELASILEADPLVINTVTDLVAKSYKDAVAAAGANTNNGVCTINKQGEAEFTAEFLGMINGEMVDLEADKELNNLFEEKLTAAKIEMIPGLPNALITSIGKSLAEVAMEHRNEDGKTLAVDFCEMGTITFAYPTAEEVTAEFAIDPKFLKKLT